MGDGFGLKGKTDGVSVDNTWPERSETREKEFDAYIYERW